MKKGRTIWKTSLRLGLGLFLLVWIFHTIFLLEGRRSWSSQTVHWEQLSRFEQWAVGWSSGPPELWRTLRMVDGGALLLSLVFMALTIVLGMLRWRMVLGVQGLHLSAGRTAEISLVAHFFNSFLLGSTGGDLLKAYYAARETHHKKTEAVVTVVVDRVLGLFAMLLFACVMILLQIQLVTEHRPLAALAWLIFLLLAGCGMFVALAFWGGVSKSWPRARDWLRRLPKGELLERALEASRLFGRERFFVTRMLAISTGVNLFCVLQIWALAWGLQLDVPVSALFVIVPVVVCISAFPITPSGLGVRENLYVLMLGVSSIGVEATAALSLSLLAYAGSLFWSFVGGLVYLNRREKDHLTEIAKAEVVGETVD